MYQLKDNNKIVALQQQIKQTNNLINEQKKQLLRIQEEFNDVKSINSLSMIQKSNESFVLGPSGQEYDELKQQQTEMQNNINGIKKQQDEILRMVKQTLQSGIKNIVQQELSKSGSQELRNSYMQQNSVLSKQIQDQDQLNSKVEQIDKKYYDDKKQIIQLGNEIVDITNQISELQQTQQSQTKQLNKIDRIEQLQKQLDDMYQLFQDENTKLKEQLYQTQQEVNKLISTQSEDVM